MIKVLESQDCEEDVQLLNPDGCEHADIIG